MTSNGSWETRDKVIKLPDYAIPYHYVREMCEASGGMSYMAGMPTVEPTGLFPKDTRQFERQRRLVA